MAVTKVVMPKLSEAMETGKVIKWLKQEGDRVQGGDILAEVETDKADVEMEAFGAGVLRKILVPAGSQAPVGSPHRGDRRARRRHRRVAGRKPQRSRRHRAPARPRATADGSGCRRRRPRLLRRAGPEPPGRAGQAAARRPARAAALGPAAPAAPGSGSADACARRHPVAARRARAGQPPRPRASRARQGLAAGPEDRRPVGRRSRPLSAAAGPAGESSGATWRRRPPRRPPACAGSEPAPEFEDLPLSPMRATIARRMPLAKAPVPHFYVSSEVAMDRAWALREELNALEGQPKISVNDLVVRACALALMSHPGHQRLVPGREHQVPSPRAHRDRGRARGRAHHARPARLSGQVAGPDRRGVARSRRARARAASSGSAELSGATFSISNLGMYDVAEFSAIINPPEGAILAVGAVRRVPVVDAAGALGVGRRMMLTLSCDHRVMDGAMGARFLQDLRRLLEEPLRLLV